MPDISLILCDLHIQFLGHINTIEELPDVLVFHRCALLHSGSCKERNKQFRTKQTVDSSFIKLPCIKAVFHFITPRELIMKPSYRITRVVTKKQSNKASFLSIYATSMSRPMKVSALDSDVSLELI